MEKKPSAQTYQNKALGWQIFRLYLYIFALLLFLPIGASAEVLARGVEQHSWRIDASTAEKGITVANVGERVRVGLAPRSIRDGTGVEIVTFASEYYVYGDRTHRVTPIYRVTLTNANSAAEFPVEVRYPEEDLGRKTVWVWGDDDIWREIPAENAANRGAMRINISSGITYFAVFADNQILETGFASWYKYKNCLCAASPDYPKGVKLRVTNVENGKVVIAEVNDYGPDRSLHPDRVIDLDLEAFKQLANPGAGLVRVKVGPV